MMFCPLLKHLPWVPTAWRTESKLFSWDARPPPGSLLASPALLLSLPQPKR